MTALNRYRIMIPGVRRIRYFPGRHTLYNLTIQSYHKITTCFRNMTVLQSFKIITVIHCSRSRISCIVHHNSRNLVCRSAWSGIRVLCKKFHIYIRLHCFNILSRIFTISSFEWIYACNSQYNQYHAKDAKYCHSQFHILSETVLPLSRSTLTFLITSLSSLKLHVSSPVYS